MQTPPPLADRRALMRNRARAARAPADFLRHAILAEVQERLIEVNRTFTAPAVVTARPDLWTGILPGAHCVVDEPLLRLGAGAHDLVIHDMALHWADDPVGQMVQCRHALRPDGLFLATLFGGLTLHELRAALAEAEVAETGGLSPRIAPMGEIRDLGGLLQRAGFAMPVADATPYDVRHPSALHLMHDLRAMGEGNALAKRLRRPARRGMFLRAADILARHHGTPEGIRTTFEVVTLTGWAPAPDQPRALRPGSATHRLADLLSVTERPLDPAPD